MPEDPQEEFEDLRRLLALKRHEQPPPGYFENFSVKVRARIEADALAAESSWFQRLISQLVTRPAQTGLVGAAFVGLVAAAAIFVPMEGEQPIVSLPGSGAGAFVNMTVPVEINSSADQNLEMALRPVAPEASASSLNPVLAPDSAPAGLFNPNGVLPGGQFGNTRQATLEFRGTNLFR